ncbi:hypothetical protein [Sulfobacillus harzensis]|uniref:Uncharacterized protein n=1 Tax=Sulfobacillus harzensis TaxID=2729629 RepID=A0A7Y0L5Y0_9FIRM|nr:hypothetical protein [Sulfobacillus harzensis]NMP23826.1 hypothetical protein [Sulfobacillus harzensis]
MDFNRLAKGFDTHPGDPLWHDAVCRPLRLARDIGAIALIWDAATDTRHGWGTLSTNGQTFVRLSHCPYCGQSLMDNAPRSAESEE